MTTDEVVPTRKLTPKGQATRDRIVAAAASLIAKGGVAGTSVEDVQQAAGVRASQLYHYFGDKRTLVRAVISYQTGAMLDAQEPFLRKFDTMDALRAWRDALVAMQRAQHCEGGCPMGTLAGELAEACPDCRADLADGFARWESAIRDGLRAMHDRGDLRRSVDPDRLAVALLASVQGGLLLTQVRRDVHPLEAALDTALDHIESLRSKRRSVATS